MKRRKAFRRAATRGEFVCFCEFTALSVPAHIRKTKIGGTRLMLSALLELARNDSPLWLPDLRDAFLKDPAARPLLFRLTLHDGTQRDFPCAVPRWETEEEHRFAEDYTALRKIISTPASITFSPRTAGGSFGFSLIGKTPGFAPCVTGSTKPFSSGKPSGTATAKLSASPGASRKAMAALPSASPFPISANMPPCRRRRQNAPRRWTKNCVRCAGQYPRTRASAGSTSAARISR